MNRCEASHGPEWTPNKWAVPQTANFTTREMRKKLNENASQIDMNISLHWMCATMVHGRENERTRECYAFGSGAKNSLNVSVRKWVSCSLTHKLMYLRIDVDAERVNRLRQSLWTTAVVTIDSDSSFTRHKCLCARNARWQAHRYENNNNNK